MYKEFSNEELKAIREYFDKLLSIVNKCNSLLKYPNSRLGTLLDKLYDAIGDEFPFDIEL